MRALSSVCSCGGEPVKTANKSLRREAGAFAPEICCYVIVRIRGRFRDNEDKILRVLRPSNGGTASNRGWRLDAIKFRFPDFSLFFPVRSFPERRSNAEIPSKDAQTRRNAPPENRRIPPNSLKNSLLTGISPREGFAIDCVRRHLVLGSGR